MSTLTCPEWTQKPPQLRQFEAMAKWRLACLGTATLLFLGACSAWGRIGETQAQVEEKLGKGKSASEHDVGLSITPDAYGMRYFKNDTNITVVFYKGVSQLETYSRYGEISDVEIKTILQNNSLGGTWSVEDSPRVKFHYVWTGDKATSKGFDLDAYYYHTQFHYAFLVVQTGEFARYSLSQTKQKEQQRADGL